MSAYRPAPGAAGPARTPNASDTTGALGVVFLLAVTASIHALTQSPPVVGVFYALGFMALTWSRPTVALAMIIASTPFQYDISAGGPLRFSIAEINLALSIPMWLLGPRGPRGRARAYGLGLALGAYFAVAILSSALHWRGSTAVSSLLQMWLYMIATVGVFASIGRRWEDYVRAMLPFLAACAVLAVLTPFMRGGEVYGLHKNGVGASLAAAVVVGVELRIARGFAYSRRFVTFSTVLCAAGLTISLSRGAWLAAATGVLVILALRGQFRALSQVSIALVPAVLCAWFLLPAESKEYAFNVSGDSIKIRYDNIEFARRYFIASPVLGEGVGLRKEFDATNVLWVTLAETGILGAATFMAVQAAIVWMALRLRLAIGAADPRFTFAVLAAALILGRLAHGMFDHYWSRGAIMVAWAAVGMMVKAHGEAFGARPAGNRAALS